MSKQVTVTDEQIRGLLDGPHRKLAKRALSPSVLDEPWKLIRARRVARVRCAEILSARSK